MLRSLSGGRALLVKLVFRFPPELLQIAFGDDLAVHFGGDLFHHLNICRGGERERCRDEYYKPAKHRPSL
jgi:hypothetical protein